MKTAVEWLAEKDTELTIQFLEGKLNQIQLVIEKLKCLQQAKEMEKEQMIESYCQGCADLIKDENIFPRETSEQYYNETFKQEKK